MRPTRAGRRPARSGGRSPGRTPSRRTPSRSTGRPAPARTQRHRTAARRPAGEGARLTFTHRAAVLGLTLCAVLLMLAYPAKEYLGQRSAISAAAAKQQALQAQLAELAKQHAAATDPQHVVDEARARLHYTLPGTRNYLQVAPPERPATTTHAGNATVPSDPDGSWFGRLYDSDRRAGS